MRLPRLLLAACATITLTLGTAGGQLAPAPPRAKLLVGPLLAGTWKVEFANGVTETVDVKPDGTASVTEPARTSGGKATGLRGTLLIEYDDDRVERWTPVGRRAVVEHWFPASQFPNGTPVRGIADFVE